MRRVLVATVSVVVVILLAVSVVASPEELTATEKRKLETQLKMLQSRLDKVRAETPRSIEKQIKILEDKLEIKKVAVSSVSLAVDFVSAYVFRGATFNDGFVIQPGVDIAGLPVDIGVWANADVGDYDGAANDGQFSEIDIYASYALPVSIDKLGVSVGYCEYTYPGWGGDATVTDGGTATETVDVAPGEADRELSVGLDLDVALAPSISFNWGIDGGIEKILYVEASVGHEFAMNDDTSVEVGAAVGFVNDGNEAGESGLSHFDVSASLSYKKVSISGTYVGQVDEDVLADVADGGPYDVSFYASFGLSHSF